MIEFMDKNKIMGLTQREVKERQAQGLVNDFTASASTSTWQIIKRNVFTLFNALNFAIALALAFVQAWSNLVFFAVICFNAFSGIVTELRAKHMVDKLNLMTKEKVKTIRDGQDIAINPEELVLGDVIRLSAGEQIPSDAQVLEGFAEVVGRVVEAAHKHFGDTYIRRVLHHLFVTNGSIPSSIGVVVANEPLSIFPNTVPNVYHLLRSDDASV